MARKLRSTELLLTFGLIVFDVKILKLTVRCRLVALLEITRRLVHRRLHVGKPFARRSKLQLRSLLCKLLSNDNGNDGDNHKSYLKYRETNEIIINLNACWRGNWTIKQAENERSTTKQEEANIFHAVIAAKFTTPHVIVSDNCLINRFDNYSICLYAWRHHNSTELVT